MKRFLLFVAVATLFAACSKDGVNEISNDRGHAIPSVLYASIDTEDETRIQLDELQKTVWTEGDLVSVFYYCNGNTPFEFKGKTGDRDGKLGVLSLVEGDTEIDKIVSIYPYSEEYTMNTTKKYVSVKLPATQHYLEGSYGVGDNLMAYVGDDDSNLSHKNLCGWIKIQLKGSGIVTKITLKGNDGEQLAGDAKFYYEDFRLETLDQGGLAIGEYIETITLDCGKGVTLDAETPTEFYFVVAPHTFAKGITIEATCSDGTVMTKSTSNKLTVERNHIKPMAALPVDATILVNNKIWYTNGSTTEPTAPNKPAAFGSATIQSNTYDAEKECWVITFDKDITEIGEYAFYYCTSLTSVTIPDSVTTIGYAAFYSCDSLMSVTIPDSVTTIGEGAFGWCRSLTSVTIPDSVTTIGGYAFSYCSSLKEFKGKFAADGGRCLIIDGVLNAFAIGCGATQYTIPDSVTTIGNQAFNGCTSLTSVTIGDSVTTIGDSAFMSCTSLTSVTIPDSVTTIGNYTFSNCESLTSVTIPDSVTTIEDYAFVYCSSLKTVYCKPTTPPTGGDKMFDDNASERKIYVAASEDDSIINAYKEASGWSEYKDYIFEDEPKPANNEIWYTNGSTTEPTAPCEPAAFGNATIQSNTYDVEKECWVITFDKDIKEIGNYAFNSCGSLTSVTIGDSVTTIGDSAFRYCYSLTSVTIGNGVTTIGEGAFAYCDSLKEFKGKFAADGGRCLIIDGVLNAFALGCGAMQYTIPDSVTTIGRSAFNDCYSLTSVTIGNGVTTIGSAAFFYCGSLTSVYCKATTPPAGGADMFPLATIYIPEGSLRAYKMAEYWSEYADRFVEYDFEAGEEVAISNKLFYTATAKVEPYDTSDFNAAIVSNEWDEATGVGVITFDGELTTIGYQAFYDRYSLTSVTIPDSVTRIGQSAFAYCHSLTSVVIPDSVTTIGYRAFYKCSDLTNVTIGDSVTTIGEDAFYNCGSLTNVTIPDSVTTIGEAAFGGCSNLAEFKGKFAEDGGRCLIKDNTIIAYANASGTTYTIPDSVTTIENWAFGGCSSLTSVTIPDSVMTIGDYAFYDCDSLTSVYCEATTPPTLGGSSVFDYIKSGRKIYVPAGSVDAYKAKEYWSKYADYIFAE